MHIRTIRTLAVAAMTLLGTGIPLSVPAQETGAKKEAVKTENYSFSAKTDKADAIYKKGEPVTFTVQLLKDKKPVSGVKLQYRLSANGDWGKMQSAVSDKPVVATTKLDKPGWVSIEVYAIGPDGKRVKKPKQKNQYLRGEIGAMVAPLEITESAPEPADFDAFWKTQREALNKVPVQAERKEIAVPEKLKNKTVCYDVKVKCAGAMPVSGYLCMPKNAKKGSLPAVVSYHGAGVRSAHKQHGAGTRYIHFDVNAHGIENGKPAQFYADLAKGELKDYRHRNKTDRNRFYFKEMYLRVMRALDYVKTLPEWDGKTLIVRGGSQGGGQSIVAAALDPQVTFCYAAVPALGDHAGRLAGHRPGWPQLANRAKLNDTDKKAIETGKYFDNVYFAKRIKCESYFTTGFVDFVCPPISVYAAYNNLPDSVTKNIQTTPTAGHNAPGNLANKRCSEVINKALADNAGKK